MRLVIWSLLLASLCITDSVKAQVNSMSEGLIYLGEDAVMAIFGTHKFSGTIETFRGSKPGMVVFTSNSEWLDASDQFNVDGYVKTFKENEFTFPIGHHYVYRPISLSMALKSTAAYFYADPHSLGSIVDDEATNLSEAEYWHVHLNHESQISLSWGEESQIEKITASNLNQLTILGLRDGIWQIIPSEIDDQMINPQHFEGRLDNKECDFTQGSITTNEAIIPGMYEYFTLGSLVEKETIDDFSLSVFPNPQFTVDQVKIDYAFPDIDGEAVLRLFKSDNSLVFQTIVTDNRGIIDFSEPLLESGLYVISLTSTSGKTKFQNLLLVEK